MTDDPFKDLAPVGAQNDFSEEPAERGPQDEGQFEDLPPAPPAVDGLDDLLVQGAAFDLNDDGNGNRFALYFGEDLIWVPRVGWFSWNGQYWQSDPNELAVKAKSQRVAHLVKREVFHVRLSDKQMLALEKQAEFQDQLDLLARQKGEDGKYTPEDQVKVDRINVQLSIIAGHKKSLGDLRSAHRRFANQTGNSARMKSMREESAIKLSRQLEELDVGALDVNTQSGVLRFWHEPTEDDEWSPTSYPASKVVCLPHSRDQLLTKIMPVSYLPAAKCPQFDAFLARIQPDPSMRAFLMRWFALSMTAKVEQKLCYFYGMGANGKSVLIDLMARIIGDYAATAKIESLTGTNRRGGGDATPDLMQLIGARFVRAAEPDEGMRWQEGLIKELTGGEPMLVRALHADFVNFVPTFSLVISGNHKPDIRGTDDGIWRRLLLVPFDVQIPEKDQIAKDKLDALLFAERDGIFMRLCEALREYLEVGLSPPDEITNATAEFRAESDPFGSFLDDACVVSGDESDTMTARELVNCFHFWLLDRAEGAFKDRTVSMALKDKSRRWVSRKTGKKFTARKSNGSMRYDGIALTDTFRRKWNNAPKDTQGRALAPPADAGDA